MTGRQEPELAPSVFPTIGPPGPPGPPDDPGWDAFTLVDAAGVGGDEIEFAQLDDGPPLLLAGPPGVDPAPFAAAVGGDLAPPFRASAVRQDGDLFAVGANAIEVASLPGESGDALSASSTGGASGELAAWVGRAHPELPAWTATATRLAGELWQVDVQPL